MSNAEDNKQNDPGPPSWLRILFLGIIVGGVVYAIFFHGFLTPPREAALRKGSARFVVGKADRVKRSAAAISQGKALSAGCQACHGAGLKGSAIAPNLMDGKWLHGSNSESKLYRLVVSGITSGMKFGSKTGVMPARGALGSNGDVWKVVYYISSKNRSVIKDVK